MHFHAYFSFILKNSHPSHTLTEIYSTRIKYFIVFTRVLTLYIQKSIVMYKYEWDDRKDVRNFFIHGITFDEATAVFKDQNAIELLDEISHFSEQRIIRIGLTSRGLFTVVYSERDEFIIRIISA